MYCTWLENSLYIVSNLVMVWRGGGTRLTRARKEELVTELRRRLVLIKVPQFLGRVFSN